MSAPRLVVMAGGSASGKSTLARLLQERMPDRLLLLQHDRYYRTLANPEAADFDHPDALDTDLLVQNLDERWRAPGSAAVYDSHRRRKRPRRFRLGPSCSSRILTLAHGPLAQRADLRVFVHADADVRLAPPPAGSAARAHPWWRAARYLHGADPGLDPSTSGLRARCWTGRVRWRTPSRRWRLRCRACSSPEGPAGAAWRPSASSAAAAASAFAALARRCRAPRRSGSSTPPCRHRHRTR